MTDEERDEMLKASHTAIEDAIQKHMGNLGIEGLMTGFVMGASVINMTDEGEFDGMWSTQSDNMSKWAAIGLSTMLLANVKDYGAVYSDDDDD